MIAIQDIRSLTDFQRNTKTHLRCLAHGAAGSAHCQRQGGIDRPQRRRL